MTDAITKFNVDLQAHLKEAQNRLTALNSQAAAGIEHANKELHRQVLALDERANTAKAAVESAHVEMKKWMADSVAAVSDWKSKNDVVRLNGRADRADRYALAASQVAVASVEAAERAALDARLARAEADEADKAKAGLPDVSSG